jgi:hypothetical protein
MAIAGSTGTGIRFLPIVHDGEGDHPKGGGGVEGGGQTFPRSNLRPGALYPSTMLRMVPLPKLAWGG